MQTMKLYFPLCVRRCSATVLIGRLGEDEYIRHRKYNSATFLRQQKY